MIKDPEEVARVVGEASWDKPGSRMECVATLWGMGLTMREMATAMGIHHTTAQNDKQRAALLGILPPRPEGAVDSRKPLPTKLPGRMGGRPRRDLSVSWLDAVDIMLKKARVLEDIRLYDDRMRKRWPYLLRSRGDLMEVRALIDRVLDDLQAREDRRKNGHHDDDATEVQSTEAGTAR